MGCVDGLYEFAKYILFVFNTFLLIIAAALIGLPISAGTYNRPETICVIVIGVATALLAIFGCYGAFKGNKCILIAYGTILILEAISLLGIGIYILVAIQKKGNDQYGFLEDHRKNLKKEYEMMHKGVSDSKEKIDEIQKRLECCGMNNKYEKYVKSGNDSNNLISSCCKDSPAICTVDNAYNEGCADKLRKEVVASMKPVGIACVTLGPIFLVMGIFALLVRKSNQQSASN